MLNLSGYDPNALPVAQAQDFIAHLVPVVQAVEQRPIRDALGRVLARDIVSASDVPAHDNSAMDGFALRGAELLADAPTRLRIVGSGLAGQDFSGAVPARACVRITTGAVDAGRPGHGGAAGVHPDRRRCMCMVPPGLLRRGDNRRLAGEDLARGEAALAAGRLLRPADLGLLASLGLAEVPVRRRLRVAFFSTGDELRSIGEPLDAGCVYDSNRYTVWGMLQRLGVRGHRPGRGARRPGGAARSLRAGGRLRRCGDHLGRRQRRRGRPHQAHHGRAGRGAVLAHRDASRTADGHRAHRHRDRNRRSCSGCPATRWR